MADSKIYLSSPYLHHDDLTYLTTYFAGKPGDWVNKAAAEFDLLLGDFHDCNALCTQSATSAMHLLLRILGVEKGDVVIGQSFSFIASINPAVYLGAEAVFVGSESDTWNMCPDALSTALKTLKSTGKRVKAVIVTHLYGMPAKITELRKVCDQFEVPLIEDAAEALGAIYKNKYVGSLGNRAVLSFNRNKVITTIGGGALLTPHSDERDLAFKLSTQAREEEVFYQHEMIGYNYRMGDLNAALGLAQWKRLNDLISARQTIFKLYLDFFSASNHTTTYQENGEDRTSNRWLSTFIFDAGDLIKNGFYKELEKEKIEARPLWKPLHLQPIFRDNLYFGNNFESDWYKRGVCFPSTPGLIHEEIIHIGEITDKVLRRTL